MQKDIDHIKGQCHCGRVKFEVDLPNGLHNAIRCNCSLCRMKGAVMVFTNLDGLKVTSGSEYVTDYQFNTNTANHHFCSKCGIHTHHQRRYDPTQYAVNVACLENVSPFDFEEVPVVDGNNHPMDVGGDLKTFGILKFVRTA